MTLRPAPCHLPGPLDLRPSHLIGPTDRPSQATVEKATAARSAAEQAAAEQVAAKQKAAVEAAAEQTYKPLMDQFIDENRQAAAAADAETAALALAKTRCILQ